MSPSHRHSRSPRRARTLAAIICSSFLVAGCASGPSAGPADQPAPAPAARAPNADPADAWSILIVAYTGPDQDQRADIALRNIQTQGRLPGAYRQRRGDTTVIAYGRYPSPDTPAAQADLRRIRSITLDGGRPFADAVLVPPPVLPEPGAHPEYDLRAAKRQLGPLAAYTLQIGIYKRLDGKPPTPEDLQAFRTAAEQAVVDLRREGVPAYYIHLPQSSTVTVGIFGPDDYRLSGDPAQPPYQSPELLRWRQRFPHNLVNGSTVMVRTAPGREPTPQSSGLVAIPDDR